KVYKGKNTLAELSLLAEPTGLCYYHGEADGDRPPAIAVVAGPYIFIYRNLRPYYKFTAPLVAPSAREEELWGRWRSDEVDAATLHSTLGQAREEGERLGPLSNDFLSLSNQSHFVPFLDERGGEPLSCTTSITCITTLQKSRNEPTAAVSLVVGTESCEIVMLEPPGTVICKTRLGGVPAMMAAQGLFTVEWRVVVACRDSKIYTVKGGEGPGTAVVTGTVIELEASPCALVRNDRQIYVATTDNRLHSYHIKGKRNYTLDVGALITNLEVLSTRATTCLLVALSTGCVQLYNNKTLVHTLFLEGREAVSAMRFGSFAREDNTLAIISVTGRLSIYMLNRKAQLSGAGGKGPVLPPEQDIPLKV
ncbi:unnamed protein product, partial [Discosporangium mesarthrocarpum]